MADLSNQKIKNTYQNVLQVDVTGNLQNLTGGTPSLLTINGGLKYVDGTQQSGYVMKSDANGNASWGALNADIYLSAATLNGTTLELDTTSGNTLSVDLSSLSPWEASGSAIQPVDNNNKQFYLWDNVLYYKNLMIWNSDVPNTEGHYDYGDTMFTIAHSRIGGGNETTRDFALAQTDTGETIISTVEGGKIHFHQKGLDNSVGHIHLMHLSDGEVTIEQPTTIESSLTVTGDTTLEGNILSGNTNLLDIFLQSESQNIYWSANTDGSISNSGLTNNVGIGTATPNEKLTVVGDISASTNVYSNNLVLKTNVGDTDYGQITPDVNHGTIKFMTKPPGTTDNGETLTISQDLIEAKCSAGQTTTVSYMKLQPVDGGQDEIIFNGNNNDIDFLIKSDNTTVFKLDAANNMMAFRDYVGIGQSGDKWPTDNGSAGGTPTYQLRVIGQTFLSGDTTPLEVIGNISGTTNLYIDGNMYSGTTNLLDMFVQNTDTIDGGSF